MDRSVSSFEADTILLNNLKILGADLSKFTLNTEASKLRLSLRVIQKPALTGLIGFLLSKLDPERYQRTVKPLMLSYNRVIDNRLKHIFFAWVKELPMDLGLSTMFSRVWSCPCPDSLCRFLLTLSSSVLENLFGSDISNAEKNEQILIGESVNVFLQTISDIKVKTRSLQSISHKLSTVNDESTTSQACMNYLNISQPGKSDIQQELSAFQKKRWDILSHLKSSFFNNLNQWYALRPFYIDVVSNSKNPPIVCTKKLPLPESRCMDFNSLTSLLNKSADLFNLAENSLARPFDEDLLLTDSTSPDLSWCSSSLLRLTKSSGLIDRRTQPIDVSTILQRLDVITTRLNKLIKEEQAALSVSISENSAHLSDLHLENTSLDKCDNFSNLIGASDPQSSPNGAYNINSVLFSSTDSDNLADEVLSKSIPDEDQVRSPYILPPLEPLRLSTGRSYGRSNIYAPFSPSWKREEIHSAITQNTRSLDHSDELGNLLSKSSRSPLGPIDGNIDDLSMISTSASEHRPKFHSSRDTSSFHGGIENETSGNTSDHPGEEDSLGLLSFADMSEALSQLIFSTSTEQNN